jgi:hypothetical protein
LASHLNEWCSADFVTDSLKEANESLREILYGVIAHWKAKACCKMRVESVPVLSNTTSELPE